MDQLFPKGVPTWHKLEQGLFSQHIACIDDIVKQRLEQGFARATVITEVRLLAALGQWLRARNLRLDQVQPRSTARNFMRETGVTGAGLFTILSAVLATLEARGAIVRESAPADAIESATTAFGRFLIRERGLSECTRLNYIPFVERFLRERFQTRPLELHLLTGKDVADFVRRHARDYAHGRIKLMLTALRVFLRYLLSQGEISVDLSGAVPAVADWRLHSLPKALPADDVEQLLNHCDLQKPAGHRDHAILLLMARLGLRAGDVVHLELGDLDWEAGEIVLSGKGRRVHRLPLPQDVGTAIAAYLQHKRPKHAPTRRVFVGVHPPFRGLRSSAVLANVMRRALDRARLAPARKGTHLLRHSLATRMLRGGASLAEIGQILRHKRVDTTSIYAKVDLESLRPLALPWPGGSL